MCYVSPAVRGEGCHRQDREGRNAAGEGEDGVAGRGDDEAGGSGRPGAVSPPTEGHHEHGVRRRSAFPRLTPGSLDNLESTESRAAGSCLTAGPRRRPPLRATSQGTASGSTSPTTGGTSLPTCWRSVVMSTRFRPPPSRALPPPPSRCALRQERGLVPPALLRNPQRHHPSRPHPQTGPRGPPADTPLEVLPRHHPRGTVHRPVAKPRYRARRLQALPRPALAGRLHPRLEAVGGDQRTTAGVDRISQSLDGPAKSQPVRPAPRT